MSYPDKEQRKTCWDSRDRYWECLDKQNVKDSSERPKACTELRKIFEKSCPTQWVTHFDRKRDFNVFKEKMQKEGYEPIRETQCSPSTFHAFIMDQLVDIIAKINIPTNELKSELIQQVLLHAKKNSQSPETKITLWNEVANILWLHLQCGLNKYDEQLLCATCFYTVLTFTDKKKFHLNEVLKIINNEFSLREHDNKETPVTKYVVSLMYGMFQSAFLTQQSTRHIPNVDQILQSTFKLLIVMAYEYSRFTYIAFKTINSFKKVCGTDLQEFIFNKDNQVKLLNLINHNWENPVTGVRDLNKDIFQTLILVLDEQTYVTVLEEINSFYWNKAKYLMLSEIVKLDKGNITNLIYKNKWIDGLLYSLHKPGLVSAGADMYYAIYNQLRSEEEWCKVFLPDIIKILNGSSNKAIENFNNYWCLTSLKRFPTLFKVIMHELENLTDSEQKLYSSLYIMKQANKLGLIDKSWGSVDQTEVKTLILIGLEHYNGQMRMLAFDILCVSQGKSMPTKIEYELVLKYLNNNINSDCTVLRLCMLNSFSCFLTQVHTSFLSSVKYSKACNKENLQEFCKEFQELIISSLEINGNYQRKLTSIITAKLFLNNFNDVPRKKQKQTQQSNRTIIEMLRVKDQVILIEEKFTMKLLGLLNDPAEDIRENVIELLYFHYFLELRKTNTMNHLIENALKTIRSKFFYQISCGKSMFKLIIKLLLKEKHSETIFTSVEEILKYATDELISEYELKRSIVESIENGKQLHSFMSIVHAVLEVCQQSSCNITIPKDRMLDLLNVLDGISNQFVWEQNISISSDFSKISDMVENLILQSGCGASVDNDNTKISGLHQIVLNCLWLNVKASCDLSTLLIQYQKEDSHIMICERCINIITHVLETCRHKGAIEAAGVALGKSIRYLTSLPEDSNLSNLPYSLLKLKLNELISEASKMASVTRRGAGLSIMVHRIVSSDTKKGKPLFHYFINTLLETCKKTEDIPSKLDNAQNIDNEKDLPKAIYIHYLTRIVTDSSLASDVMYYSAELAELAFGNLISPHWQIRNAALQLYGALIPKLIGQKKASGSDEETIATVACDELRTHSPKFWKYTEKQLNNQYYTDKLQYHSNLLPILNMLANIARRYNFMYDVNKESDESLLKGLIVLLDSPIYTVRRLTAKCICNIYSFEEIYENLIKQECLTENILHGCLMLMANCYKLYFNNLYEDQFKHLKAKFSSLLYNGVHSYFCKEQFENMFLNNDLDVNNLNDVFSEVDCNVYAPGIHSWALMRLQKHITNATWTVIPQILKIILNRNDFESYCEFILSKIPHDANGIPNGVLLEVANILMFFDDKFNSGVIWKILYQVSLKVDLSGHVETSHIIQYMKENIVSYKLRYIIPFVARISVIGNIEKDLLIISETVYAFTDCETTDVELRYIAAMANNELNTKFIKLPSSVKITVIKSAVVLLQDEDEDVRNLSVNFYKNFNNQACAPHPFICLNKILDYKFLCSVLSQPRIKVLIKELEDLLSKTSNCNTIDEYNPFASDSKNIYLEVGAFRQLILNLKNY